MKVNIALQWMPNRLTIQKIQVFKSHSEAWKQFVLENFHNPFVEIEQDIEVKE